MTDKGYSYNFCLIIMPLIKLLAMSNEFSWSQKIEIACALNETINHYKNMIIEMNRLRSGNEEKVSGVPAMGGAYNTSARDCQNSIYNPSNKEL